MTTTFDPFDELAAMFLTSPAEGATTAAAAQAESSETVADTHRNRAALTEILIVGHLPVRAGLWLTPYADALAREMGTTALLRLDSDEASMQLLRAPEHCNIHHSRTTLQQCIDDLGHVVDLWVLRLPHSDAPADMLCAGVDRITILSSADEAAIVAAYQIVKDLAQAAEKTQRTLPTIGLAVVGAEQRDAAAVVERLNRTTVSFLGVEVRLAMCLPRMDAGVRSSGYATFANQPCPTLPTVMTWIEQAKAAAAKRQQHAQPAVAGRLYADRTETEIVDADRILRSPSPAPPSHAAGSGDRSGSSFFAGSPSFAHTSMPHPPHRHAASRRESIDDEQRDRSQSFINTPINTPRPTTGAASPTSNSARPVKLAPKPSVIVEAKHPARQVEPDNHGQPVPLANYVGDLIALPIRCPGHERVEIAVDRTGRLHVLGREQILRELAVVRTWAHAHRELIAMACSQHQFDPNAPIACHVFTDRPTALADLHNTDLHLHVLAPVVVNGQTGWYAAPLNVPAAL